MIWGLDLCLLYVTVEGNVSVRDGGSLSFNLVLNQRWEVVVLLVSLAAVSFELVQLTRAACSLLGNLKVAWYVPDCVYRLSIFEGLKLLLR